MKIKLFVSLLLLAATFVLVRPVLAGPLDGALGKLDQSVGTSKTGLQGGGDSGLADMITLVINTVLGLVGTIFFVLVVYAGILWMTAQGDEEKVTKAKSIITAAVIGMIVTLSAYAITYFVGSKLNQSTPINNSQPVAPK